MGQRRIEFPLLTDRYHGTSHFYGSFPFTHNFYAPKRRMCRVSLKEKSRLRGWKWEFLPCCLLNWSDGTDAQWLAGVELPPPPSALSVFTTEMLNFRFIIFHTCTNKHARVEYEKRGFQGNLQNSFLKWWIIDEVNARCPVSAHCSCLQLLCWNVKHTATPFRPHKPSLQSLHLASCHFVSFEQFDSWPSGDGQRAAAGCTLPRHEITITFLNHPPFFWFF